MKEILIRVTITAAIAVAIAGFVGSLVFFAEQDTKLCLGVFVCYIIYLIYKSVSIHRGFKRNDWLP